MIANIYPKPILVIKVIFVVFLLPSVVRAQPIFGLERNSNSIIIIPDSIEQHIVAISSGEQDEGTILSTVERLCIHEPELALFIIQSIIEGREKHTLTQNWAKLQYFKIWLLVNIIAENEELELLYKEALNWSSFFDERKEYFWHARTQSLISNICYNICFSNNKQTCSQALVHNNMALTSLSKFKLNTENLNSLLGEIYRIRGNIYLIDEAIPIDSSLRSYNLSLEHYQSGNNMSGQASLLLNKAILLSHRQKGQLSGSQILDSTPKQLYNQAIKFSENLGDKNAIAKAYLEYATYFADQFQLTRESSQLLHSNNLLRKAITLNSPLNCEINMQLAINLQNWVASDLPINSSAKEQILDSLAIVYLRALHDAKKENNLRCHKELLNRIAIICPYIKESSCSKLLHTSDAIYSYFIQKNKEINARITQKNIAYLSAIEAHKRYTQRLWFTIVIIVFIALFILFFYQKKREEVKALNNAIDIKLEALRAQMNPHFISNTMNAIESLVNQNRNEEASEYLIDFSRLCRLILEYSKRPFISLKEEVEALKYFLSLEKLRLTDDLDYSISIDNRLNQESIFIPPMLLQPFVENAIWHGIKNKQEPKNGELKIEVNQIDENNYICIIEDNGVGREKAKEIQENSIINRSSWGTTITQERLDVLQNIKNSSLKIIDLIDNSGQPKGTKVIIQLPFHYKQQNNE